MSCPPNKLSLELSIFKKAPLHLYMMKKYGEASLIDKLKSQEVSFNSFYQTKHMNFDNYVKHIRPILLSFVIFIAFNSKVNSQRLNRFQESKYLFDLSISEGRNYSQLLSFIGLHKESLKAGIDDGEKHYMNKYDSIKVTLNTKDANHYFLKAVKENPVVVLNEAHNMPNTRAFLYNNLDSLKALGVNYIFFEAFGEDSLFPQYGFPSKGNGVYTQEVVFSEILRKMYDLKMKPLEYEYENGSYDSVGLGNGKFLVSKKTAYLDTTCIDSFTYSKLKGSDYESREVIQALNIVQQIKYNPNEKYLIFCGYSHGYRNEILMGGYLTRLLPKNPFIISQTILRERGDKKVESPIFVKYAYMRTKPFVLLNKKGELFPFSGTENQNSVDACIGIPPTRYVHNRPTWQTLNGVKSRISFSEVLKDINISTPYLVLVYYKNEFEKLGYEALPADAIEVHHYKKTDLILKRNRDYNIFVIKDGRTIINKTFHFYE